MTGLIICISICTLFICSQLSILNNNAKHIARELQELKYLEKEALSKVMD